MSIMNDHGDVVFVEYRNRRPFAARVRTADGNVEEYEFEFCKRDGRLYYREGGGPVGEPNVAALSRYHGDPSEFWAADDVRPVDDDGNAVLDASEVDGWVRLAKPRGDPFEGAAESDTEECNVCHDRLPSERLCEHLFWGVCGIAGAGRDAPDVDDLDDIERTVRKLGCARALRRAIRSGDVQSVASALRGAGRNRYGGGFDDNSDEGVGLAWLGTLDEKTTEANAVVLRRLEALVAEQRAKRASGERCYRVKVDRRAPKFTTERTSWAEAMAAANIVRRAHEYPDVWIVRVVPRKARRT